MVETKLTLLQIAADPDAALQAARDLMVEQWSEAMYQLARNQVLAERRRAVRPDQPVASDSVSRSKRRKKK